ncbi:MAG: hypothetical protein JO307_30080 [Bryobacterales bacterium]|nr:hypothetical protein [Bryobacterales bacterium]
MRGVAELGCGGVLAELQWAADSLADVLDDPTSAVGNRAPDGIRPHKGGV